MDLPSFRIPPWPALTVAALALLLSACATSRPTAPESPSRAYTGYVKDSHPAIWRSNHAQVARFRRYYARTRTVEQSLRNGKPYLPTIKKVFEQHRLPPQLAYLPMLESRFENRANSGDARGMWQFTRQTAQHMGLRIGPFVDERMNWRKASEAAARYLDTLGERFHYDWALALAAYNGGPNYLEDAMRRQRSDDFFDLRLRKETEEYVPRFLAMLQVAQQKELVALQ